MLDEGFRRRVGELTSLSDGGELDDEARERIIRRLVAEGPAVVRSARRARRAALFVGPLLAAAAVATLMVAHRHRDRAEPTAALVTPASNVAEPACASRRPAANAGFVAGAAGPQLDLGATALAVSGRDAEVSLAEASPCRTVISLGAGTVTVHAKDLGGGELVVRTRDGDVTVHGTVFAVTESTDTLLVEVSQGRVEVGLAEGVQVLTAGERLLYSKLGVARGAVEVTRAHEMRALVGAPEVVGFDALSAPAASRDEHPVLPSAAPRATEVPRAASTSAVSAARPSTQSASNEVAAADDAPRERVADAPASPVKNQPAQSAPVDWLAEAEAARRAGDYAGARERYRQAAEGEGPTAEAAWVALARMELGLGHSTLALEATKRRRERFGQGTLAPEALWIDVRAYRQSGDVAMARQLAEELMGKWPSSPQARAARRWVSEE